MNVLVTGASSMIGRFTVSALACRGDVVTTLQRRHCDIGDRELNARITDRAALADACANQEAIVHLAAKVGVTGTWSEYEETNVNGTRLLLEAAQAAGVPTFVHVSSPSVAHDGTALVGVGAEPADPARARGHYAISKAEAEQQALSASSAVMAVVAIRPHLVWGPGDTQLVGRIIERARRGRLALVGSGMALIDTTYVDNAAQALVAAADRASQLGGRAFVVSNGEPRTVHELVARMVDAAGVDWSVRRVPTSAAVAGGLLAERIWDVAERTDDPPMTSFLAEQLSTAHWFDQRETQSALGWAPEVSLAEGFRRLAAWYASGADRIS